MTIYGYRIAVPLYTAGTGTISATTTALTGSGTNFDPQTPEGTIIHATASGQTLVIASVTDDTNAVLVTAPVTPLSGAAFTYTPMVNIETVFSDSRFAPRSKFFPWLESKTLGNSKKRGAGRPYAIWRWGFLPRAMRDLLKAYCPGASASVFIRTRKNDTADAYVTYSAEMWWPDGDEDKDAGRRINFSVEFRGLVAL